jgi:hypothetical protein
VAVQHCQQVLVEEGEAIMPSKSAETTSRNFNPMSTPGLSDEARQVVNTAFDAMSAWRSDISYASEKNVEQVIEKMAAAARALGWPQQVVDVARLQIQSIAKMQIQTMDQIMDAWEEQIKSPNPSQPILSKLKSFPSFGSVGTWPGASASQMASMNPLQIYMQFAEQWQKSWADAMAHWGQGRST